MSTQPEQPKLLVENENTAGETVQHGRLLVAFFPQEIQDLNLEIQYHPKCLEYISKYNFTDQFEECMVEISAYCGIVMDGFYTKEDLVRLAGICATMMRAERMKYSNAIEATSALIARVKL